MNIAESNAFFHLMRSMETDATDEQRHRGLTSAEYLAKRARLSLNAGPAAPQIVTLVEDVQGIVADYSGMVELSPPPVEVARVQGDLL